MPSLDDIPENILETEDTHEFLTWLRTVPIDFATRRRIISLWQDATGKRLTAEQVRNIRETATDSNGFQE